MNGQDEANVEKAPRLGTAQIMLVLVMIAVAIEIVTVISWYLSPPAYDDAGYGYDYDTDEYFAGADASERGGMGYLTDDEVRDMGIPCTELMHFDFSGDSLIEDITAITEDMGLGIDHTEVSSYNQMYGDGGSWYETLLTFYLTVPGDTTDYQRITLNCDTATDALHEIDIFLSDKERLLNLCGALLKSLGERTGTFDASQVTEAADILSRSMERGENMYASFPISQDYDLSLTLYCFDDGYSVYIGRE